MRSPLLPKTSTARTTPEAPSPPAAFRWRTIVQSAIVAAVIIALAGVLMGRIRMAQQAVQGTQTSVGSKGTQAGDTWAQVGQPTPDFTTHTYTWRGAPSPSGQTVSVGTFPRAAPSRAQYGPRLRALVVDLVEQHLVPYARVRALLADLFGATLSSGTLVQWIHRAAQALEPVELRLKQALQRVPVLP